MRVVNVLYNTNKCDGNLFNVPNVQFFYMQMLNENSNIIVIMYYYSNMIVIIILTVLDTQILYRHCRFLFYLRTFKVWNNRNEMRKSRVSTYYETCGPLLHSYRLEKKNTILNSARLSRLMMSIDVKIVIRK